jgi:hypothetical protein
MKGIICKCIIANEIMGAQPVDTKAFVAHNESILSGSFSRE